MTPRKDQERAESSSGLGKEQKEDETKRRSEDDSDVQEEEEEEKLEHYNQHDAAQKKRRLAMNRESARQRRRRNRVLLDDLHQDNGRLRVENAELRRTVEQLRKRVQELENTISSSLPFLKTSAAVSSMPSQANGTYAPSSTALNAAVLGLPQFGLPTTTRGSLMGTVMSSQSEQLAHQHELLQLQQLQQLASLQALQPRFAAGGVGPPPALIHPQVSRAMAMNAGISNGIGSSVGAIISVNDEQQNQQRRPTGTSAATDEDDGSRATAPAGALMPDSSSKS